MAIPRRIILLGALFFFALFSLGFIQYAPAEVQQSVKEYAKIPSWQYNPATEEADLVSLPDQLASGQAATPEPPSDGTQVDSTAEERFAFLEDSLSDQFPAISHGYPVIRPQNVFQHTAKTEHLKTNLFIAFGRNWFMLHQCIVSFIAAGWPASDITVFDNSGVMAANLHGQLTVDNPAYVNVSRLTELGVKYERIPTLLTFSQLQNFYLSTAISRGLDYYFWGHMDVTILTDEERTPYKSFYEMMVEDLVDVIKDYDNWALHFYSFDWLTLVNVKTYNLMGGWDVAIPYYTSDCDFYSRVMMWGDETHNGWNLLSIDEPKSSIYDTSQPIQDLSAFFPESASEELNSARYQKLRNTLKFDMEQKGGGDDRNHWQNRQAGGQKDPYFRSTWIRDESFKRLDAMGKEVFEMKWHTGGGCQAHGIGKVLADMYN